MSCGTSCMQALDSFAIQLEKSIFVHHQFGEVWKPVCPLESQMADLPCCPAKADQNQILPAQRYHTYWKRCAFQSPHQPRSLPPLSSAVCRAAAAPHVPTRATRSWTLQRSHAVCSGGQHRRPLPRAGHRRTGHHTGHDHGNGLPPIHARQSDGNNKDEAAHH